MRIRISLALAALVILVACTAPTTPAPTLAPTIAPQTGAMDKIIQAAQQEGELNVIALPHDWCGYGDMIEGFNKKYSFLKINEFNPDAGSNDQLDAIKAYKDDKSQAPDVIDIRHTFAPSAQQDGLLQPYKVATWDTIPNDLKDAAGFWYGNYYGVLTFEVNTDLVKNPPQDWADLLKPEYKNQVALAGDPRSSHQAIQSVYAAGLANGGTADSAGQAGLDWFAKLNKAGNLVPTIGKAETLATGGTPIVIRWDYLALIDRDTLKDNRKITVVVPKSGVLGGIYVQAISAYAPHPNAAKLWVEYLYSDEGQLGWLRGYCHPIRFNDLFKNNKIPADVTAKLPPTEAYFKTVFPTLDQQNKNRDTIVNGWDSVVGANIK